MKQNGRGNALLVELLIVVLFFMLAATTLMEIFGAAKQSSSLAGAGSTAILQVQNMTERLYAAEDMCAELEALGFVKEDNAWQLDCSGYALTALYSREATAAGVLHCTEITASHAGRTLFTLPATRYVSGEVAE